MAAERRQVAIVGTGFAGSLLARILAARGVDVVLLEKGSHPRFALGESSTPLANLALERLASRYGFEDLYQLATHGRWKRCHPELRCGLKRGFTFYHHELDQPYHPSPASRMLVAASPRASVADTHWLRADVDHHFVRQAVAAGADYRDLVTLREARSEPDGIRLVGARDGEPLEIRARFVVDGSGPAGFLAREIPIPSALRRLRTRSALLFGHFRGVRELAHVVDAPFLPGPYPDEWAAVHHLFAGGWCYSLRFDDGLVSAGALLAPVPRHRAVSALAVRDPETAWASLLLRLPSLALQFGDAKAVRPVEYRPRVQHRLTRAAGHHWAVLPHTFAFVDPLFSTGIAWSLIGVERLAGLFEDGPRARPSGARLRAYDRLLNAEADQIDRLIAGAYSALGRFRLFAAQAQLYFAAVSWAEIRQRLGLTPDPAWSGFLGADDTVLRGAVAESLRRVRRAASARGAEREGAAAGFEAWVRETIEPRNLAGLADPARGNLYPIDNRELLDRHELLGLDRDELDRLLPRIDGR